MDWSWKIFFISLPLAIIFSMFSRGAMNAKNVEKYGPSADYRSNIGGALIGSIFGGIVWALIITAVAAVL